MNNVLVDIAYMIITFSISGICLLLISYKVRSMWRSFRHGHDKD